MAAMDDNWLPPSFNHTPPESRVLVPKLRSRWEAGMGGWGGEGRERDWGRGREMVEDGRKRGDRVTHG